MIRSVVKHKYIGLRGKGKDRAKAHVNYIQYRAGQDREEGPRPFFNNDREDVRGEQVKKEIAEDERINGVVVHKLILSPGVQGADLKEYTRELMDGLGREKGLDLEWYGVEHKNTQHHHIHVVVLGEDRNGRQVRLDLNDMNKLRELGDRYLEREHYYDRYMDRDSDRVLSGKFERDAERVLSSTEYFREGDDEFQKLVGYLPKQERDKERREKEKEKTGDRDDKDFRKFDEDMRKAFRSLERGGEIHRTMGRQQRMHEGRGRTSDFHATYVNDQAQKRLDELAARYPDRASEFEKEKADLEASRQAELQETSRWLDLDGLLGERYVREEPDHEKGRELTDERGLDHERSVEDETKRDTGTDISGFDHERSTEDETKPDTETDKGSRGRDDEEDRGDTSRGDR